MDAIKAVVDIQPVVDGITDLAVVGVPAVIAVLAIRKGISFVIGLIRSA